MIVSVIMAAFQAEATIAESIRSLLAQTHPDWELIVVDDGSTDGTAAVAQGFGDPRIRVLREAHRGVLGAVRNRGIAVARGEAVALLDADDLWQPLKLERQVAVLRERPEVGVVHTGFELLLDGGACEEPLPPPAAGPGASTLERLLLGNFVCSSSACVRRSLLDRLGPFDETPELWGSPDYELWLRLAPETEFALVNGPLVLYRVHGAQMSASPARMNAGALTALAIARRDRPGVLSPHAGVLHRTQGILRCTSGLPGRGRGDLLRAVALRPGDRLAWSWLARSVLGEGAVRAAGRLARQLRPARPA